MNDPIAQMMIDWLNADPMRGLVDAAEHFGLTRKTVAAKCAAAGFDFTARREQIRELEKQAMYAKWPAIRHDLDHTNMRSKDIATKNGVSRHVFAKLARHHGYQLKKRGYKSPKHAQPKVRNNDIITRQMRQESLSGDGLSMLAHRVPLNRICEVMG